MYTNFNKKETILFIHINLLNFFFFNIHIFIQSHIFDMEINSYRKEDNKCSLLNYNTYEETAKHWVEL